jgi:hypothetical protein
MKEKAALLRHPAGSLAWPMRLGGLPHKGIPTFYSLKRMKDRIRNSPWQRTHDVRCCGARTVRADNPQPHEPSCGDAEGGTRLDATACNSLARDVGLRP